MKLWCGIMLVILTVSYSKHLGDDENDDIGDADLIDDESSDNIVREGRKGDKGAGREKRRDKDNTGKCDKDMCDKARTTLKVNSKCIKNTVCVRQFVRDMKKLKKQQARQDTITNTTCTEDTTGKNIKQEISEKLANLEKEFQILMDSKKDMVLEQEQLKHVKISCETKNKELISQVKGMGEQVNKLTKKVSKIDLIKNKKEELTKKVTDLEQKNKDMVKSLEVVESQQALRSHNISIAVNENKKLHETKQELEKKVKELEDMNKRQIQTITLLREAKVLLEGQVMQFKGRYDSEKKRRADTSDKLETCTLLLDTQKAAHETCLQKAGEERKTIANERKERREALNKCMGEFQDLRTVNEQCRNKIGELNMCKTELGKLGKVVEAKLSQVKAENRDISTFRGKNIELEDRLEEAQTQLSILTGNLSNMEVKIKECKEDRQRMEEDCAVTTEQPTTTEEPQLHCDSPCTISKLAGNDLIMMEKEDRERKESFNLMKVKNEELTVRLEEVSQSLEVCLQEDETETTTTDNNYR